MHTVSKFLRRFVAVLCLAALLSPDSHALQCATASAGVVQTTGEQPPSCASFVLLSASDYSDLRNPFTATPDFSTVRWAVGATLLMWVMGVIVGLLISVVRKARA